MNPDQSHLLRAETTWFHLFRTMFSQGDVAKMGPYAFTVYCAIKAHANFNTGEAFPGIPLIAQLTGISKSQVKRTLDVLDELGYLSIDRSHRKNHYTLREKIAIEDADGHPTAIATWDYLPLTVQEAMNDLRNVLVTGDFAGAKIIQIQHLTVNVNSGSGTQINLDMSRVGDPATKEEIKDIVRQAARQGDQIMVLDGELAEQF